MEDNPRGLVMQTLHQLFDCTRPIVGIIRGIDDKDGGRFRRGGQRGKTREDTQTQNQHQGKSNCSMIFIDLSKPKAQKSDH